MNKAGPTLPVDGQALRSVMRRVPAPLAVVTAAGPSEARGMTIASLASVSLDPPLVSFNVRKAAQMHPVLAASCGFAIHIMGEHQAMLCERFSRPNCIGSEQFAALPHTFDACGSPILEGSLAVLHCRTYALLPAGDHSIVLGEVTEVEAGEQEPPLLFYRRSFRRVGEEVTASA